MLFRADRCVSALWKKREKGISGSGEVLARNAKNRVWLNAFSCRCVPALWKMRGKGKKRDQSQRRCWRETQKNRVWGGYD